jgi:hypothetical protein
VWERRGEGLGLEAWVLGGRVEGGARAGGWGLRCRVRERMHTEFMQSMVEMPVWIISSG